MNIEEKIIEKFEDGTLTFADERTICRLLHVRPSEYKAIGKILRSLEKEGVIMQDRFGAYATPQQLGAIVGTVHAHTKGFAFLIPQQRQEGEKDYFIPHRSLNGALNKDTVLAVRVRGTEDEVQVVRILQRGDSRIVGTFEKDKRAGYVIPDDNRFDSDIYIPLHLCQNAKSGDKVVCEITSYPKGKMPGGQIIEVLGEGGDFYVEELSIIRSHDLIEEFPYEVEHQAERVSQEAIDLEGRHDLREEFIITIDGEDTRDIDDGVSLVKIDDEYVLGVHIADVSHYVKRGTALDKEAYARGTSVYFPDRVLPMLPQSLSNGACSLNEGEDRYAMSCYMRFDKLGNKLDSKICQSVIHSSHRMTYHQIEDIYNGDEEACATYPDLVEMVANMAQLTKLLQRKRHDKGSIDLDVKEAHIYIDENDELVIPDYERLLSHHIIEQFMVSANESVAEFLQKENLPCLYRVHEKPNEEKAGTLLSFLRDLGVHANLDCENITPKQFAQILKQVEGKPYASVVNRVMLRSMQKARYSEENVGHFGLASDCYCHFTSPIRRYPDLFVHRVLTDALNGQAGQAKEVYGKIAHDSGIDLSACERRADEAERDVDDLYKVVYMSERIGQEFDGVVSGVTNFGVFVELPNTIEGLIQLENLPRDEYELIENTLTLKGHKNAFRLGDSIKIRVDACDWGNMRVLFGIAKKFD